MIDPKDKVKLIDFEDITKNDFAVVDELPFSVVEGTEEGSFRPDINILVNGMPLAFLEVKKPNNDGGIQTKQIPQKHITLCAIRSFLLPERSLKD